MLPFASLTLGYYGLAVISAVVPWVNAEVIMLSAVPLAHSPVRLAVLVGAVTLGQMSGKTLLYWFARTAATSQPRAPRLERTIVRWREPLRRHPVLALGVLFVSALVGLPPFYLVTMAAGTLHLAFGRFVTIGTAGRLAHFAILGFLPQLLWRPL